MKKQIQWTGDNLKEVVKFVGGLHPSFNEWFKSWEDYEQYVREHGNIFKYFLRDGRSHYKIQVGCWIEYDSALRMAYPITEGKFKKVIIKSLT